VPGDKKHAPWLELTKYELAKLRKRMKKNAVWSPSDTMILRELKILGRGIEGYRAAKQKAEAAGEPFEYELPTPTYDTSGKKVMAEGAISIDAISRADLSQENRGMKLNQAKKLKRENEAKELAKLAEESARKMAEAARAMKGLFAKPPSKAAANGNAKGPESPSKPPAKTSSHKKRKRESTADTEGVKLEPDSSKPAIKPQKKSKTETPIPAPLATAGGQLSGVSVPSVPPTPDELPAEPVLAPAVTTPSASLLESSPKKASTPILPPTKDNKKDSKKELKRPAAISTTITRRRTSTAATPTPAPEVIPTRRPPSRASSRPTSRGKAASVEPTPAVAAKSRSRRASTVHNTPAPEVQQPRPSSRRGKRPAPGVITKGMEGSAVSVGKRSAATRKKAGLKKQQKDEEKDATEIWDEIDDEGNIISPTEPRYCLCNRVSFGVMIECENADVCLYYLYQLSTTYYDIVPRRVVPPGMCRSEGNSIPPHQMVLP
jgi:hypothetical protein